MIGDQTAGAAMLFVGALFGYAILLFWLDDYFDHGGITVAGILCPLFGFGFLLSGFPVLGIAIVTLWNIVLFALIRKALLP